MNIGHRLQKAKEIHEELISCERYEFSSFNPSMISDNTPGVYAIYDKGTNETMYVGKTTNLRQRLYNNHLMGPLANARLKKYIIDDDVNFPHINDKDAAKQWIKDNCSFQFIVAEDYRERGHIEGLISFLLDTRYVDIEH